MDNLKPKTTYIFKLNRNRKEVQKTILLTCALILLFSRLCHVRIQADHWSGKPGTVCEKSGNCEGEI